MDYDFTIIGAGAVGLAIAAELSQRGSVLILEKEEGIGRGISSRSSEVAHAGIYYERDSLKARLCVAGRRSIEEWGEQGRFSYRRIGKYIVAVTAAERAELEALLLRGRENGAGDLRVVSHDELRTAEPHVRAECGVFSPSTGIFDSHGLMRFLLETALKQGAQLATRSAASGIRRLGEGYEVAVRQGAAEERLATRCLVNAAGLFADEVAALAGIDVDAAGMRLHWNRGEYFQVAPSSRVKASRLIYPVPGAGGHLGIHVTLDLAGQLRLGPSAEYVGPRPFALRREDYTQDERLLALFWEAARRYLPELEAQDLRPCGTGIRPKLNGPGEPARDFYIREESARGLPGFVNCVGIESPGLTAAPAIGRYVARLLFNR
ncbi:MAG: NAD(P)/FAD-dependent oxidoreductase [Planctomycetes bacterium]|nr:NAD(P)/FAD-dependent oxidoreductase [Planctomycetota bacterium]